MAPEHAPESLSHLRLLKLYFRAFCFRDLRALHSLAASYAVGEVKGVNSRFARCKAAKLYRRGAAAGHAGCQYDYGLMILLGETKGEMSEGKQLIERAAAQGHVGAADLMQDHPLWARGATNR